MGLKYPKVMSEDATVDAALAGRSLSRYGDGELRVAKGHDCISQKRDPALAKELQKVLAQSGACLPCIPNVATKTPKRESWNKYADYRFTIFYTASEYGSSFITRPDSAPWIDRHDYWQKVTQFWAGKDVTLVLGTDRSLRPDMMTEAKSLREVWGPRRDAYAEIDRIEEEIGRPSGPILLCLGCAASVLAYRLAEKGLWAIDLGHMGMFMRGRGSFGVKLEDLISPAHQAAQIEAHKTGYPPLGHLYVDDVLEYKDRLGAILILDYGCGKGSLKEAIQKVEPNPRELRVWEFDPGVADKEGLSKVAQLVACINVIEHVEPDKLNRVMEHIYRLSDKGAFFVIDAKSADANDWVGRIKAFQWTITNMETKDGQLKIWTKR